MAKRLLGILLLLLYLIPSIGVSGSVHYCGGEVAAVVLIPTDEHPCACGPDEPMDSGCCQDKAFSFKIKDTHKKSVDTKVLVNNVNQLALHPSIYICTQFISIADKEEQYHIKEKEPPDRKLFVLHESYLI